MITTQLKPSTISDFITAVQNVDFGKTLDEKFRLALSIGLFVEKAISLEKAAELSGKKLSQFIDVLISKNIQWNEYTEEHHQQDVLAIKKYSQEKAS